MKTFKNYLSEFETQDPCIGDSVGIEIGFEDLIETYISEILDDGVLIESDKQTLALLESCGCTFETIRRYGAAVGGDASGWGSSLGEDQDAAVLAQKELDTEITNPMPGVHEEIEQETSPVERAILHRILMQHPSLLSSHGPRAVMDAVKDVADFVGDVEEIGSSDVSGWVRNVTRELENASGGLKESDTDLTQQGEYDQEGDMAKDDLYTIIRAARKLTGMLDDNENMPEWVQSKINKAADYVDTAADYIESNKERGKDEIDEAEYQGREVTLNKPTAGDVKKSKVYVKDPVTGNIKKVNFGHGGTSAKRAGQKTMHIKKDNPERRKNFRARHNCENPGPKTKARYWSCRAW